MIVISTRDFRMNQTKFLDMANNGEDVVLKSRNRGSFRITPIKHEEKIETKRDITTEIVNGLTEFKEYLDGKRELQTVDSLIDELRAINS